MTTEVRIPATLDEAIAKLGGVDEKACYVLRALQTVQTTNAEDGHADRKGMHVVYSGFNAAFQKKFGETSQATTDEMERAGIISMRPSRGGPTVYYAAEAPALTGNGKMKAALAAL